MSAVNQFFKALSVRLLRSPSLRTRAYKAVMYPDFVEWCHANPCEGFHRPQQPRADFYEAIKRKAALDGPIRYLEFGVFEGASIRWWVEHNTHASSTFVGFDSFEGLPEDWNQKMGQGHFSTKGAIPEIADPRCSFEKGWFSATLRPFLDRAQLDKRDEDITLVLHMDADLYSSSIYVMTTLAHLLRVGDVVIFDEFSDTIHEFRALVDFCAAFPITFEAIAHHDDYIRVALRITSIS